LVQGRTVFLQVANYFNVGARFQDSLFARKIAFHFCAECLGRDWLRKGVCSSRQHTKQALGFGPCGVRCPRRAMATDAAHKLRSVMSIAQIVEAAIALTTRA